MMKDEVLKCLVGAPEPLQEMQRPHASCKTVGQEEQPGVHWRGVQARFALLAIGGRLKSRSAESSRPDDHSVPVRWMTYSIMVGTTGCNARFKRQSGHNLFDHIVLLSGGDYLGPDRGPISAVDVLAANRLQAHRRLADCGQEQGPYVGLVGGATGHVQFVRCFDWRRFRKCRM